MTASRATSSSCTTSPRSTSRPRRTVGVEALVRWNHPAAALLMPASSCPRRSRATLIEPITNWVLDEALRQQRRLARRRLDLTMAVNISPRSLTARKRPVSRPSPSSPRTWGIPPDRLILELTESAIIDADVPASSSCSTRWASASPIDDFGTGHSSLVYLQRLPVDRDQGRSLLRHAISRRSPSDAVIVRSIDRSRPQSQPDRRRRGCRGRGRDGPAASTMAATSAQGYLFSPPLPAQELTRWLTESPFGAQPGALPTSVG